MLDKIPYLAFLAPFALFFQQGRAAIGQIFSFLIRNDEINVSPHSFINFLQRKSKQVNFGNVKYTNVLTYVKQHHDFLTCWFLLRPRFIFLYKNFIPIIVTPKSYLCKITYPNIFDFNKLLTEFTNAEHQRILKNKEDERWFSVNEVKGRSRKETFLNNQNHQEYSKPGAISNGSEQFDSISFDYLNVTPPVGLSVDQVASTSPQTLRSKYYFTIEGIKILNNVKSWLAARDWYSDRQINWRKSCLLIGRPGTGKSKLILEIAKKLKLHIYIFDLSGMDNVEFDKELNKITAGSIILFEDLDVMWEQRENKFADKDCGGITFDYFINKLSGVNSIKNCFVFATTNYVEKLDPALIRPGRFDEIVEIPVLTKEGKQFIASKMLDLWPDKINVVVTDAEETAAEFENRVTQTALNLFWENKKV